MGYKKILVAVLATLPSLAHADQNETINLDVVSVTAPKDNTSYAVKNSSSATRTDTPVKEIPQSIQVIPRQLIDDQQNVTISEALKNVSGVVTNDEFSTPAFEPTRIRGFAAEQLVDGVSQYYNAGDRESLINIEKIEVLKGSNAVLFSGGAGAPVGGVVNITSKLPQAKAFGELGVKVGTDNFVQPFFDINQPLTDNVLLRITGEYTKAESNVDVIDQKRYNINPSLTLTNNSDTTFTLQGKTSRWKQQEYQGLPATGTVSGNFKIKSDLFIGNKDIPDSYAEIDGVWATLDHKFNDIWSFNAKIRYAESKFDEKSQLAFTNSPDSAPSTWALSNNNLHQTQNEQSVLLNTTAKFDLGMTKNTLLLGADYTEIKDVGFFNSDAIVARTVEGKEFKNTPGLPKSKILFNLNRIKASNTVYVVESSFDAIRLDQVGFPAVATLGANVSVSQIRLLEKYFNNAVLIADNDEAGLIMAEKLIEKLGSIVTSVYIDKKYKDIGDMDDDAIKKLEFQFDNSIIGMLR